MPRQLPWKRSGSGGGRTQTVKPSTRKTKTIAMQDDIDEDFPAGTAFASSGKGKAKVVFDSDDSLPEALSTSITAKSKSTGPRTRELSSSPAPLADYTPPHDESMRKGVSKFDLRDDEWMMVEDEFLETAKLFTRHLHIAEYDRLKESIEAKKKEADVARPVVAGAKRSVDGAMKERARVQESRQKKAIRDIIASQGDSSEDDRGPHRLKPRKAISPTPKPLPASNVLEETDSDDLDASRPPKPSIPSTRPRPAYLQTPKSATRSFAKPALPASGASTKPRTRPSRMTPFDMLDEYTPPSFDTRAPPVTLPRDVSRSHSTSSAHSPQTPHTKTARTIEPRPSMELLDDWESSKITSRISPEVADRIAKRKAARAKEGDEKAKKKTTSLDDIPTFLF